MVVKKGGVTILEDEENAKTPAEQSFFWNRLVRPTLKRGKHIIMDL